MLSNTLRLNFCYLKIIHILHPRYPKLIGHILKNERKNNCVCIHEIMQLIIIKMKMKMKNRSQRYDINRPRSRHGHKFSNWKKYLSMMMLICIKQLLSNIWSSVSEKVNPFVPNAPFLYPLKISENLTVFWCFQRVEIGCIGNEWIKQYWGWVEKKRCL